MANSYFNFKHFTVRQEHCAMKVGTDGVLLGAWAEVSDKSYILDIGTGTGLIALMCAQRSNAIVQAVEIDTDAARQAEENFLSSSWKDRLVVFKDSFQHFAVNRNFQYDLIITNPPYFTNSLKPPDRARSMARHDQRLNMEQILYYVPGLLTSAGKMALILPASDIDTFTDLAYMSGLYLSKKLYIRPYQHKPFTRCLAEFSKTRIDHCSIEELSIKKGNAPVYTEAFISLTKEFYLKF